MPDPCAAWREATRRASDKSMKLVRQIMEAGRLGTANELKEFGLVKMDETRKSEGLGK
uniref:Uncharacterized protein n=1 Tax=Arundo donax TaxID=35708 RepID=A0A0A9BSP6_ARUDO